MMLFAEHAVTWPEAVMSIASLGALCFIVWCVTKGDSP